MRYLKTYENLNEIDKKPQIGDYVLCYKEPKRYISSDKIVAINKIFEHNIGQIIKIDKIREKEYSRKFVDLYFVKFDIKPKDTTAPWVFVSNVEKNYFYYAINIYESEIIKFSKNKKDLEHIINANKYNI